MPITTYSEEEYSALKDEVYSLRQTNAYLESQRPTWAQGHTSDSVAAQSFSTALQQIWKHLGVANQTDAMAKLRSLSK